jgi:hypothetical protein
VSGNSYILILCWEISFRICKLKIIKYKKGQAKKKILCYYFHREIKWMKSAMKTCKATDLKQQQLWKFK